MRRELVLKPVLTNPKPGPERDDVRRVNDIHQRVMAFARCRRAVVELNSLRDPLRKLPVPAQRPANLRVIGTERLSLCIDKACGGREVLRDRLRVALAELLIEHEFADMRKELAPEYALSLVGATLACRDAMWSAS